MQLFVSKYYFHAKGKKNISVTEITMTIVSLTLFFAAAFAEIGGRYLVWL
jgi:hypothetical protein